MFKELLKKNTYYIGRKTADAGEGDAPLTKRARLEEPEISGYAVQWEWEGDKGVWTRYSESMNGDITDAFNSKKKMVINHHGFFKYFSLMCVIMPPKWSWNIVDSM